jgi:outer membrane protein insertion porin family
VNLKPIVRFSSRIKLLILLATVTGLILSSLIVHQSSASDLLIPENYEGRSVSSIEIVIEGAPPNPSLEEEFRALLRVRPGTYNTVGIRESLQSLFESGRVSNARVEVVEHGGLSRPGRAPLTVRFIITPQVRVTDVLFDIREQADVARISEDELRSRLTIASPGTRLSEHSLRREADAIQTYLRDRGFYRATVDFSQSIDPTGTRATVTYRVNTGEQSTVNSFDINVVGLDKNRVLPTLALKPGTPFSRDTLSKDIARIRDEIISQGYLSPTIEDPQVILDSNTNQVSVRVTGAVGPKVNVEVRGYTFSQSRLKKELPILREGTIDESAIVEGARRLRNELQEEGYFFAEVTPDCSFLPPVVRNTDDSLVGTCADLNPEMMSGRTITVAYNVELGRRFELKDIRLEGTDRISIGDVQSELRSQEATALSFIPLLGYGRGYTSRDLIEQDRRTITNRMRDLGYRRATVDVRQGVSINGDNLIITFVVTEGPLTRVAGVEVRGNKIYTEDELKKQIGTIEKAPFSRSQAITDADRIRNHYAQNGYIETDVNMAVVDLPSTGNEDQIRLVYEVSEGEKVFINRIVINGNVRTRRESLLEAIPLKPGSALRADEVTESERNLYSTEAFRQVIIRTEAAGETSSGFKKRDVIIDVEELKPRIMNYGFGYSTDFGPLGLFDIRNVNLFGKLRQGGVRLRGSQRQQQVRFEYFDPRFRIYRANRFAPLTLSLQYQRDSNVTRFFRSTIDRGNFGIVQRLDPEGKPIDEFGNRIGEPTINRFTFGAETRRGFGREEKNVLFLRYNYEDVRLYNTESLLIAPILRADRAIRLSRLGATFARDTRDNQFDATAGGLLSVDYNVALKPLGGNISFNKFVGSYRRFYKWDKERHQGIKGTVFAAGVTVGLANMINPQDRDGNGLVDDADQVLPISERFFAGGATTLRGFGYEEAGPRLVIPGGIFRNNEGEQVTLNPFSVPVGGNALALLNTEMRIPVTNRFQLVTFYDGGNVFRQIGELTGSNISPGQDPNLRADWTNTVGLGLRVKTPFGPIAVDYGYLLNQPVFVVPPGAGGPAEIRPKRGQIHFRFGQAF